MAEGPSGQIDRAALERIIRRAAELQTADRDIGDALTPKQVLELGSEVGIPARYLQQAMLEERARPAPTEESGMLDRLLGPAEVSAQRVVRGEPEAIQNQLLHWIDENELLTVQREQQGRVTWEPLRGMQVAFRRSAAVLGSGRRIFMLERAERVSATVTPLEPGYSLVALTGEARRARASLLSGGLLLLTVGGLLSAVLATMTPFAWIAAVPAFVLAGIMAAVWRQFRPITERLHLGLERALDHLERGEPKAVAQLPSGRPSLINLLAEEVRKAIRP
ncbi:MAG TPA: hypothetical protein VLT17_11215 [Gemmatimonadales bacterium]|jgi:hypothetical protein|nr:hypothetical protein [Gemmatimonadales bacterium]